MGGIINVDKYLKGGCNEDRAGLVSVMSSDRMRGTGHKVKHRRLHQNTRKHLFTVGVNEHWHGLHREVVESPSFEIFKSHLDTVLGNQL